MTEPPTSRLPPIAKIAAFTTTQLFESVQYLQSFNRPQVRGSRRRRPREAFNPNDDEHETGRFDAFERAYTIRWLTALIAQLGARSLIPTFPVDDTPIGVDSLIQQAASLLAVCAGVAAAGKIQRRFTFESTLAGRIHVDLTDIPLDNHNYGSVGAQTWGGACVLAEMIAEHPNRFGLRCSLLQDRPRPLRILELGAGTGLVGLTVAKLLHALRSGKNSDSNTNSNLALHPRTTIVLTDSYPSVLGNIHSNIIANFPVVPDDFDHAINVTSHSLDWSSFSTTDTIPDVLSTPFDVVFGADVVYEPQHAVWLHDCLRSLLAVPDGSNEDPAFHLVIPLRATHTFESNTVEEVFSSKHHVLKGSERELTILSRESIVCEGYGNVRGHADDDVDYVYYQIGWAR